MGQAFELKFNKTVKYERVPISFELKEIHFFLEGGLIVGLLLNLFSRDKHLLLQSDVHGRTSEDEQVFKLSSFETLQCYAEISDNAGIYHVELTTSEGRAFTVGGNRTDLMEGGLKVRFNHLPFESRLLKIFSVSNKRSNLVGLRLMYVKTVFFK